VEAEGNNPEQYDRSDIYARLDASDTLTGLESDLAMHLRRQLAAAQQHPEQRETIAYGLAGLMSARSLVHRPENDPFVQALSLAGELELPPAHRSPHATWDRMAELIARLPE